MMADQIEPGPDGVRQAPPADWKEARLLVARAYDALVAMVRDDRTLLGSNGTVVAVPLLDGLEVSICIRPSSPTLGPLPYVTRPMIL